MKIHWGLWVALVVLIVLIVILSARREGYAPPRDENTNPPYTESVGNVMTTSNNLPYVDSTSNVVRTDNQTQIYKDMAGMDYQIQAGNPILNFIQGDPSSNVIYGDFVPNESDGGSAQMYHFDSSENASIEYSGTSQLTCPRSKVIINGKEFGVGTHSIDQNSYIMEVYPPLHVVATGPNNARQEMNYPTEEDCPSLVRLTLDKEKTYDTLVLSTSTALTQSSENPITKQEYTFDSSGNIINNTRNTKQVYGFDVNGNIINSASATLTADQERDLLLKPDNGQYIPALTSPTIPFIGTTVNPQGTVSASGSQGSMTSRAAAL